MGHLKAQLGDDWKSIAAPPLHPSSPPALMNRKLLWLLTATTALSAGNIYYSQPLLGEIAASFHQSAGAAGMIPALTQLGYVAGLLFIAPLGDVIEKKKLVVSLLVLTSLALLGAAIVPNFALFSAFSFAIGLTSVLVQVLIPFVAALSAPPERGKNLGIVLSFALIGILLSRTLSGFVGARLGWQGMFYVGSALMLALSIVLMRFLPPHESQAKLPYTKLLKSVWTLFIQLPELRRLGLSGALVYAALSAFWASLAFYLQSDAYHLGPQFTGSFGIVGAVGALSASLSGRHAERIGPRRFAHSCILIMILSYVLLGALGSHLSGLIVGVILLDLGAQAALVSHQTELYHIHPAAQTRLNTIYKIFYFSGGACGSGISALAWQHLGWAGVCGSGILLLLGAWLAISLTSAKKAEKKPEALFHPRPPSILPLASLEEAPL